MILKVENIGKNFQQGRTTIHALKAITFSMQERESLAIVGPSGSGKTTLLSLLAGLDFPTTGNIAIDNACITSMSEKKLAYFRSHNIGIVFQQYHLMPYLTAEENVSLPLEIMRETNVQKRAQEILEMVGLSNRLNHFPHQMSGGECQRVAIARASVVRPKILLADEPSGNLDSQTGGKVMDLLFSLSAESAMTLILVTHDMQLAARCQRQIHMLDGSLQ